jgi:ribulose kinase
MGVWTLSPVRINVLTRKLPSALLEGRWLIEGGQVSGGSILSWLAEQIFGLSSEGHYALLEEVEKLAPCSSGLLTLDYWMGNRTPYRDAKLRGAIMGLSLFHDRACMYRSAMESVALGTQNVVDSFETQRVPLDHVVVAGGIRNNEVWLKTLVDVLGRPVHLTVDANLSIIAGAYRPDGGTLRLEGRPCHFKSPHEATRAGIAIIYQELDLIPQLTVAENLFLGHAPNKFGIIAKRAAA